MSRWLLLLLVSSPLAAHDVLQPLAPPGDPLAETRVCGEPERWANGVIKRRSAVTSAYRRIHPCPVTGLHTGPCPGWQMNHIIPLASGGCDSVTNIQWLPVQVKTCTQPWCVDRWERTYYGRPYGLLPAWLDE